MGNGLHCIPGVCYGQDILNVVCTVTARSLSSLSFSLTWIKHLKNKAKFWSFLTTSGLYTENMTYLLLVLELRYIMKVCLRFFFFTYLSKINGFRIFKYTVLHNMFSECWDFLGTLCPVSMIRKMCDKRTAPDAAAVAMVTVMVSWVLILPSVHGRY